MCIPVSVVVELPSPVVLSLVVPFNDEFPRRMNSRVGSEILPFYPTPSVVTDHCCPFQRGEVDLVDDIRGWRLRPIWSIPVCFPIIADELLACVLFGSQHLVHFSNVRLPIPDDGCRFVAVHVDLGDSPASAATAEKRQFVEPSALVELVVVMP